MLVKIYLWLETLNPQVNLELAKSLKKSAFKSYF